MRRVSSRGTVLWSTVALGLLLVAMRLLSQVATDTAQRTVARLSFLDGEAHVSVAGGTPAASADVVHAALNMPLGPGASLQTGPGASAEVEFPDGSVLRETENSAMTLLRLQTEAEIGLDDGLYYLELRSGGQQQFTVFAGEVSIVPVENASVRVRVRNAEPEIAVLRGTVSITRPNSYTVDLSAGESLRSDARNSRRYLLSEGVGDEGWDHWNEARAQQALDNAANRTVAREDYAANQGYGWSDLDADGTWYAMPGEGLVWQPTGADASFDPYGYGSWVNSGAGYVWASGYAWGWVPFHCGQWGYFAGFGWGWQPSYGCRSYGSGWAGGAPGRGGFPVNRPPRGWHPPQPPPRQTAGVAGVVIRRPTLPVRPIDGGILNASGTPIGPRHDRPVQVGGALLQPLAPVSKAATPHGGSAVGSALQRDFPVESGTHQPQLGLVDKGNVVVPGRAGEWRRSGGTRDASAEPAASVSLGVAGPTAAGGEGTPVIAAWHRLHAAPVSSRTGTAVGDVPLGAAGTAPLGAQGQPPTGAAGAAPLGVTGQPSVGASATPGSAAGLATRPDHPVHPVAGAGATPHGNTPDNPRLRSPSPPMQRMPDTMAPARPAPVMPMPRPAPSAPAPQPIRPAPAPAPAPAPRPAPAPSSPTVRISPR